MRAEAGSHGSEQVDTKAFSALTRCLYHWAIAGYPAAQDIGPRSAGATGLGAARGLFALCGVWGPASRGQAHQIWRDATTRGEPFPPYLGACFITTEAGLQQEADPLGAAARAKSRHIPSYWSAAFAGEPFAIHQVIGAAVANPSRNPFRKDAGRWERLLETADADQLADAAGYGLHVLARDRRDTPPRREEVAALLHSIVQRAIERGSTLGYWVEAAAAETKERAKEWILAGVDVGSVYCRAVAVRAAALGGRPTEPLAHWTDSILDAGLPIGLTMHAMRIKDGGAPGADEREEARYFEAALMLGEEWATETVLKARPEVVAEGLSLRSGRSEFLAVDACRRAGLIEYFRRLGRTVRHDPPGWFALAQIQKETRHGLDSQKN